MRFFQSPSEPPDERLTGLDADLPAGLADALPLLNTTLLRALLWLLALVLLALAAAWWLRRRARRRARQPAASLPLPKGPEPHPGFLATLGALRDRYLARGAFREGCHALSLLLREHLDPDYETASARELARRLGPGSPAGKALERVSDAQFRRRPPTAGDFTALCELAHQAVESHRAAAWSETGPAEKEGDR